MASEILKQTRSNSQELTDLQTEYIKKRRKLIADQEQDLQQLQENYDRRREATKSSGEAAINHIKRTQTEIEGNLKEEHSSTLRNENLNSKRQLATIRRSNENSITAMKDQEEAIRNQTDNRLKSLRDKEEKIRQDQMLATEKFVENQKKAQIEAADTARKTVSDIYNKANLERREAIDRGNNDLNAITQKYKKAVEDEAKNRQNLINSARAANQKELDYISKSHAERLEKQKQRGNETLSFVENKYQNEIDRVNKEGFVQLERLQKDNSAKIRTEAAKNSNALLEIDQDFTKKSKQLHEKGQKTISEQQTTHERKLATLNAQQENETKQTADRWKQRQTETQTEYKERMAREKEAMQSTFKKQNQRFNSEYQNREKNINAALRAQDNLFNRELNEQKIKLAAQVERYEERTDDPFYKVTNRESELFETPSMYVLKTFVPKHEKNNVKIRVNENGIVVSGHRRFQDAVSDEDRKVSSNAYQTFKEEFKFETPVAHRAYLQERDGDFITFKVPKLAFYEPTKKLDKKV
jgi:HSP20 family molecular chaperone IbpA